MLAVVVLLEHVLILMTTV